MTLHLRISSKLSIFQIYISVKISSVCKLLKFIKSDFATNFEDCPLTLKMEIKHSAIDISVESSTFERKLILKKTLFGLDIPNWKNDMP